MRVLRLYRRVSRLYLVSPAVELSQKRMTYHRETGHVEYKSKGGSQMKVFDVLEWLAAMCSHVPNKGEQIARYYGYFSWSQSEP